MQDYDDEPVIRRRKKPFPLFGLSLIAAMVVAIGVLGTAAVLKHRKQPGIGEGQRQAGAANSTPIPMQTLCREYGENPIAADGKYRGKRVRVDVLVEKIGRQGGAAYAAYSNIAEVVEPQWFFYFDPAGEAELGQMKFGSRYVIEGECGGHERDFVFRRIPGTDWRVSFTKCKVIGPGTVR